MTPDATSTESELRRLTRALRHGPAFQVLVIETVADEARRSVRAAVQRVADDLEQRVVEVVWDEADDVPALEAMIAAAAGSAGIVHIRGSASWFTDARWDALNIRRERLASSARARLLFWLRPDDVLRMARTAPDLWAWRGGVYSFVHEPVPADLELPVLPRYDEGMDDRDDDDLRARIAAIKAWLDGDPADELALVAAREWGELASRLGDTQDALHAYQDVALPIASRLGAETEVAAVWDDIADVRLLQGDLDEALRILRDIELPVYERLADPRPTAVTWSRIADIMYLRGDLDEALRIFRDIALPVYEHLSDTRLATITRVQIGDVHAARGDRELALEVYRKQLPVFEALGDTSWTRVVLDRISRIEDVTDHS